MKSRSGCVVSFRMSTITYAMFSSSTRFCWKSLCSQTIFPCESSTRRMYVGSTWTPRFASVPYAFAMSMSFTSAAPSVSERPTFDGSIGVVIPRSCAVWIVSSMPEYCWRNLIAGTLRDSRIAWRIVTGPWYWRSAFSGQ